MVHQASIAIVSTNKVLSQELHGNLYVDLTVDLS